MSDLPDKQVKAQVPDSGKEDPFQDLKDFSSTFKIPKFGPKNDKINDEGDKPSYIISRDEMTLPPSLQELKAFAADFKLPTKNPSGPQPTKNTATEGESGPGKSEPSSSDVGETK